MNLGGTQHLGSEKVVLTEGSLVSRIYGRKDIRERHRHRYEINHEFIERFEEKGFRVTGHAPDGRVEVLEMPKHPFYVGVQYHPEFLSRPESPHPLYVGLVRAALARQGGGTPAP